MQLLIECKCLEFLFLSVNHMNKFTNISDAGLFIKLNTSSASTYNIKVDRIKLSQ